MCKVKAPCSAASMEHAVALKLLIIVRRLSLKSRWGPACCRQQRLPLCFALGLDAGHKAGIGRGADKASDNNCTQWECVGVSQTLTTRRGGARTM